MRKSGIGTLGQIALEKMETALMETNFKKTKSKSESQCSLDLSFLFEVTKRSNGCKNNFRCRPNIKKAKILIGSLTDCVIEVYDEYSSNLAEKRKKIQHDHGYYTDSNISSSSSRAEPRHPIRKSARGRKIKIPGQSSNRSMLDQGNAIIQKLNLLDDSQLPLKVVNIQGKNRGVVATQSIFKDDFVVEYTGELIEHKAAQERENYYAMDINKGCYMYYFKSKGKRYCIDATAENGRLGRLVNHSKLNPNCFTKVIWTEDKPRLVLMVKCDIQPGTEVLYDYGDRSKGSLASFDWLKY